MRTKVKPLNGYSGYTWEVHTNYGIITRGSTLPFVFKFTQSDGATVIPTTGYKIYMAFATTQACLSAGELLLEVVFNEQEPGVIAGEITDDQTFSLPVGTVYSSVKYVKPDGRSYIFDMAKLQVGACVSDRRDQT